MAESGVIDGYLENAGRARTLPQSLAVAGAFVLEFPDEYDAFSFQATGAIPAAQSVLVGFGKPDLSGLVAPVNALQVIDPTVVGAVRRLGRTTRWVTVYVVTATAGATLRVTGLEGDPVLKPATAGEISAALAATVLTATQARVGVVWGAPAAVAMGGASAIVIAANAARQALSIQNAGIVNVALRQAAAAAVFATDVILRPGDVWQDPLSGRLVYLGEYRGITGGAAGELRVVEAT